ncbi:Uncharacterised protein [Yersinia similis]|uniref:Uncharacterized protein n=1 Tax=Yersinia similis TaxID=367190 RepID=A0A0T9R4I8_9GAMM|nr:Uncharacterised protein [Yersinia similis]CNB96921.1 Uncharacterised protein [Yersinia similis]CNF38850.1 Uncharacterised protein [Yersinia similis]CNG28493.1 Uncharacterised protein [Yersinia similis]CNI44496.1 Uncharacterised protein [Yersinia similis]
MLKWLNSQLLKNNVFVSSVLTIVAPCGGYVYRHEFEMLV